MVRFNEYLLLYPHRDAAEAEQLVSLIGQFTGWSSGWRVLDVGCGPGRHAAALEARRAEADRAGPLECLAASRARGDGGAAGAGRHAMAADPARLDGPALSLFTSFGYFERDAEHAATLAGMAATLRPGGWLVMDFLNPAQVRSHVARRRDRALDGERGSRLRQYLSPDRGT